MSKTTSEQLEYLFEKYKLDCEPVRIWIESLGNVGNGSINTKRNYIMQLGNLCTKLEFTPMQILKFCKSESGKRELKNKVSHFISQEKGEGETINKTTWQKYIALRSFLKYNDIVMPNSFKMLAKAPMSESKETPSPEKLKQFIDMCPPKLKAFLMLMRDTGLAPIDILRLRYGQIRDGYETMKQAQTFTPITLQLVRKKTLTKFNTFIGRESFEALKAYLDMRINKGEKIDSDTFLFKDYVTGMKGEVNESWSYSGVQMSVERVGAKTGLENIKAYDFRRYFDQRLKGDGAPEAFVELWMGHKPKYNYDSSKPVEEQRKIYQEHYKAISFADTVERDNRVDSAIDELLKAKSVNAHDLLELKRMIHGQNVILAKILKRPAIWKLMSSEERKLWEAVQEV